MGPRVSLSPPSARLLEAVSSAIVGCAVVVADGAAHHLLSGWRNVEQASAVRAAQRKPAGHSRSPSATISSTGQSRSGIPSRRAPLTQAEDCWFCADVHLEV